MLMIRFQRIGRTNAAAFRIVVLEKARAAQSSRVVERLGTYNPKSKEMTLDAAKVKEWMSKGAQATGSVHNLLVTKGVIEGKKVNVMPKKTPIKKEVSAEAAPATAPASETAPSEAAVAAEAPAETPAA